MLTLHLISCALKKSWPPMHEEHGAGFCFDCRFLKNPGIQERYMHLTGLDDPVRELLDQDEHCQQFLDQIFILMSSVVERNLELGYPYTLVGFGCTGGRHRSVYCVERLGEKFETHPSVQIKVEHLNPIFAK